LTLLVKKGNDGGNIQGGGEGTEQIESVRKSIAKKDDSKRKRNGFQLDDCKKTENPTPKPRKNQGRYPEVCSVTMPFM